MGCLFGLIANLLRAVFFVLTLPFRLVYLLIKGIASLFTKGG